jgi:RND family efflux transporter MFP subunit
MPKLGAPSSGVALSHERHVIAMGLRAQIAVIIVLGAALGAGWLWFSGWEGVAESGGKAERRSSATVVLVEALDLAEDRVLVQAIGTGEALRSASLHPTVAGEVVEVLFKAEQRVAAGAPLVRLDDKHARLAVRLARVAQKEAGRQVKRLEKLAPSGTVSIVRLETAQAELESASLRLAQAKAELDDRTLFAPFDGVIGLSQVDKGDRVTEETLIAILDDRSSLLVEFDVPEEYTSRVTVGDPIAVRPWTMAQSDLHGAIYATDSRIDPTTRSLRVKARIPNPNETIRPGSSFDVRLAFTGRSYPSVREVAVLWSRDGAYVWRVLDGRAEKVFVKVIRRDRGRILVEGPLQLGDSIVVEGVQGLRDGQPVEPRPFAKGQAGTTAPAGKGGYS